MSHQMLTSALERLVKHPLFQRDRFGKMDLPRMAQQAVGSYQPRFSEATCPIPTPMPNAATCPSFPSLPYLRPSSHETPVLWQYNSQGWKRIISIRPAAETHGLISPGPTCPAVAQAQVNPAACVFPRSRPLPFPRPSPSSPSRAHQGPSRALLSQATWVGVASYCSREPRSRRKEGGGCPEVWDRRWWWGCPRSTLSQGGRS